MKNENYDEIMGCGGWRTNTKRRPADVEGGWSLARTGGRRRLDARGQQDFAGLLEVPPIGQELVHFNHFLVAHALSDFGVGHLAVAVQIVKHVAREAHDRHEEKEKPAKTALR